MDNKLDATADDIFVSKEEVENSGSSSGMHESALPLEPRSDIPIEAEEIDDKNLEEEFESVDELGECTYEYFFQKFFDDFDLSGDLNFDLENASNIVSEARIQIGIETICITFFEQLVQKLGKIETVLVEEDSSTFYFTGSEFSEISNALSPTCKNFLRCVSEKTSGFSSTFECNVAQKLKKHKEGSLKLLRHIIVFYLREFKNYFTGKVHVGTSFDRSRHYRLLTSAILICKYITI